MNIEETIEFDVKTSFASRPVSRLISCYNKPDDITKEFWRLFMDWKLQTVSLLSLHFIECNLTNMAKKP